MADTPATPDAPDAVVNQAAAKYGVPPLLLWGVYGKETGFGSNVATSSAGAVGAFQFLPSTASGYNYPLTNNPTATQFRQQAEGAAHYLRDLYDQHGNWNDAVHAYSGGGYNADDALKTAGQEPDTGDGGSNPLKLLDPRTYLKAAGDVQDTAQSIADFFSKVWAFISDPMTWIRFGEGIAGMFLVYFGLRQLTGS